MSLSPLIESRRVVLCVGCGGVGKTTTAAAIGLAAAMIGKRTLCLTIDPARRLAESLGLGEMKSEAQTIDPERFAREGLSVSGSLTVMMLDSKSTFDELISQYAPSAEVRDRIFGNRLYQYVSTSLAGTQEYMAMEKLYSLRANPAWDLIVLDTPPTSNALDFLDAPERMVDALDSPVLSWMTQAFKTSGRFSLNLLARGASAVLRGMSRLTGYGFLEALAEFLVALNDLFGGFRRRATEVASALRGPDVAYVLVTSPAPMSVREIVYFAERLQAQGMHHDALVVNRVHHGVERPPSPEQVEKDLRRMGVVLDVDAGERVLHAARDEGFEGELDRRHLSEVESLLEEGRTLYAEIPAYGGDVRDIASLARVAKALMA